MKNYAKIVQDKNNRDIRFITTFTNLAWDKPNITVFKETLDYVPNFHLDHDDFFNYLYPTMNYYAFKFLFREHDDCIEIGWISHLHGIYKRCFTRKHSKQFLKAGLASAINAMKELAKKEKYEPSGVP